LFDDFPEPKPPAGQRQEMMEDLALTALSETYFMNSNVRT